MLNTTCGNHDVVSLRVASTLLSLLLLSSVGCVSVAGLQDMQYCVTNKTRAQLAWWTSADTMQRRALGSDYAHGYKTGFYDAATGRGCKLPAVPPPCYWSTKYQCCEGQATIQEWYRGYQCGVAAAQGKGYPSFHDVPVGPCAPVVNETGCQGCSSPDYCNSGNCNPCNSGVSFQQPQSPEFHGGLFGQYGSQPVEPANAAPMQQPAAATSDLRKTPTDGSPSDTSGVGNEETIAPPKSL